MILFFSVDLVFIIWPRSKILNIVLGARSQVAQYMLHDIGYINTKNFQGGYLLFKGKVFTLLEFQIDAD